MTLILENSFSVGDTIECFKVSDKAKPKFRDSNCSLWLTSRIVIDEKEVTVQWESKAGRFFYFRYNNQLYKVHFYNKKHGQENPDWSNIKYSDIYVYKVRI